MKNTRAIKWNLLSRENPFLCKPSCGCRWERDGKLRDINKCLWQYFVSFSFKVGRVIKTCIINEKGIPENSLLLFMMESWKISVELFLVFVEFRYEYTVCDFSKCLLFDVKSSEIAFPNVNLMISGCLFDHVKSKLTKI